MLRRSLVLVRVGLSIVWMCAIVMGALGACQLFWHIKVGGYAQLIIFPAAINFGLGSSSDGWNFPCSRWGCGMTGIKRCGMNKIEYV